MVTAIVKDLPAFSEGNGDLPRPSSPRWRSAATLPGGGAVPAAAALAADFYDCPQPEDVDTLDAYPPGTVLDPLDREVVDLLAEITAWEQRGRL
jgi:hypothetical protein